MTDSVDGTAGETGVETSIGYADAVVELESILAELESSDVDVDRLADRVRRAAGLIELCRARIGDARVQIDAVVSQLQSAGADTTDGEPD
jgi:exodeoxyribonuclease VII small subunit